MKSFLMGAAGLALLGGYAVADEVVIHHDPAPEGVVVHRSVGGPVEEHKVITHEGEGCESKTVTKSNEMGDTKSKTVTDC